MKRKKLKVNKGDMVRCIYFIPEKCNWARLPYSNLDAWVESRKPRKSN